MKLVPSHIYHIYNQGNNRETIFKSREDYLHFLEKVRFFIKPISEILCYCLMPNHFHFMIMSNDASVENISLGNIQTNKLSNAFRLLQSEYAQDYNKKNNRTGSLFRQKIKSIDLLERESLDAVLECFNYIHLNPSTANIVAFAKDWEFSSLKDYLKIRNGTLCNQNLAFDLLGIDINYIKEMALDF
ncbi:MAG TPA: hypothetical protein PK504_00615 [Ferruginibacter sp.]|nr:hypothetical protein [Ferruginibacter sp.]HRE62366.1 hypothetical protein [Ferruginibacter sp.]